MKRFCTLLLFLFATLNAQSQVKILEFYGGGGSTATSPTPLFKNDYVVLINLGSSAVNLSGYSIQYGSATSGVPPATWSTRSNLSGTIAAGACFLIKLSTDGAFTGADLPTPNFSCDNTNSFTSTGAVAAGISASATNGKIALVNGTTMIDNTTIVVDKLGYGTANNGEGTVIGALSTTTVGRRKNNGQTDTDNNVNDFDLLTTGTPNSCPAIPVELVDFKVRRQNQTTKLEWQTATELNNNYYDIERSMDGKTFEKIGDISGYGNSSLMRTYSFVDEKPNNGINYYRLRQVDFDGTATLSKTVSVDFSKNLDVKVYPNIVKEQLTFEINGDGSTADLSIVNMLGQVVKQQNLKSTEGVISLNVNNLANGQYILKVTTKSGQMSQRFEKQ